MKELEEIKVPTPHEKFKNIFNDANKCQGLRLRFINNAERSAEREGNGDFVLYSSTVRIAQLPAMEMQTLVETELDADKKVRDIASFMKTAISWRR